MNYREPPPAALHTSKSTPGLSNQLTRRISWSQQHNPTVIHRPKQSSRPTVLSHDALHEDENAPEVLHVQGTMSDIPSLLSQISSPFSSSNPMSYPSTAPTSIVSSGSPYSGETVQRGQNGYRHLQNTGPLRYEGEQWLVFPRQDSPKLSKPSIASVENAVAAKVYFESHFDVLLGNKVTPRSLRQRQMMEKLSTCDFPTEQLWKE